MAKLAIEKAEKTKSNAVSFEEAVSLTGFGYFNLFVTFANGGCLMCVILETMGMMFISPSAKCDLQLTLPMQGYLSGASFLGVVSGSHLWGFLADTRGRKITVLISMIASFLITLTSSIAHQDWLFVLLRYLNGLFVGGSSGIVYAYAGEFHNAKYRPKILSLMSMFVGIANMTMPGLAWLILPGQWSFEIPMLDIVFKPWRLLVIIYGLPSLFFAICILIIPESPKYLLTQGKQKEVLQILKNMFAKNKGKSPDEYPVTEILCDENDTVDYEKKQSFLKTVWDQTAPLIRKSLVLKTLMVCALQFGAFASTSGLAMWFPEVLNKMTMFEKDNPDTSVTVCKALNYHSKNAVLTLNETIQESLSQKCTDSIDEDVFQIGLIIGAFLVFVYLIVGSLINSLGKKWLLIILFGISSATGLAAQYVYGLSAIKILMGLSLTGSTSIGVITAVVVDLYPTQVRAMALAISFMFGRIGAVAGSHITGIIFYYLCDYTFVIFTADNLFLILLVCLLLRPQKSTKMITPLA